MVFLDCYGLLVSKSTIPVSGPSVSHWLERFISVMICNVFFVKSSLQCATEIINLIDDNDTVRK